MATINIVHTETHDETKPAGSRARSLGDDDIREKDRAIRERLAVDHVSEDDESGEAGIGIHKQVTMRASADAPTTYEDVGYVYLKTVSGVIEKFYKDSAGNEIQITSGGYLKGESVGGSIPVAAGALIKADVIGTIYPVGSVYISILSTNPATLLGVGTWVAFGAGKTLVGLDSGDTDFDVAEETGGEKTHTLIISEIPSHTHKEHMVVNTTGELSGSDGWRSATQTKTADTDAAGSGGAHNNLQPYIVVYMWKRTA